MTEKISRTNVTPFYCMICGARGLIDCGKALLERSEILDCLNCGMRVNLPIEQYDGIQAKSV